MPAWETVTPIDTFANPETGSQVELVSMVHVAQPRYYQKLGSYIMAKQNEGFLVHYEGITSDEVAETTGPLDRIKQKLRSASVDNQIDGYVSVIRGSSYALQPDSDENILFAEDGSEIHDVSQSDIARHMGLITHLGSYASSRLFRRKLEKAAGKGQQEMDETLFSIIQRGVNDATSGKSRKSRRAKTMLHMRNQVALEAVNVALEKDPQINLILIWGVGHLAGLQSGLLDQGYEHIDRQEVVVAVSDAQLNRSLEESHVAVKRTQAKMDRYQATTRRIEAFADSLRRKNKPRDGPRDLFKGGDYGIHRSLVQFEEDYQNRQRETKKRFDDMQGRSDERMRKLDDDCKRRQRELFGAPDSTDKTRTRRYLHWFSAK